MIMRYMVFGGNDYYPAGGMDDFVGAFDDLDEAVTRMRQLRTPDERNYTPCDWCHVYDVQEGITRTLSDFD